MQLATVWHFDIIQYSQSQIWIIIIYYDINISERNLWSETQIYKAKNSREVHKKNYK